MDVNLRVKLKPLGVPYRRNPKDKASHDFIDLRTEPDRIAEIPEVASWPALKDALTTLNSAASKFGTLGCGCWFHDQKPPRALVRAWCYVDVCFADLRRNADPREFYN